MKTFANPLIAGVLIALCQSCGATAGFAQTNGNTEYYSVCSFHPQAAACEKAYQQALNSSDPSANAVKSAYENYGKYLKPGGQGLTGPDRKYLQDNQIDLPPDVSSADLGGLHNLIHDPGLGNDPQTRRSAAINFLNRAVESELYCHFNNCDDEGTAPLTS